MKNLTAHLNDPAGICNHYPRGTPDNSPTLQRCEGWWMSPSPEGTAATRRHKPASTKSRGSAVPSRLVHSLYNFNPEALGYRVSLPDKPGRQSLRYAQCALLLMCALTARAEISGIAWGDGSFGQTAIFEKLSNVVQVAAGGLHS